MITLSGSGNTKIMSAGYNTHLQLQIVPAGGDIFNPIDKLISGRIRGAIDQACATMELTFERGLGIDDNLAPLIAASDWNVNGPLLYGGNFIQLETAITDPGDSPSVYDTFFRGRIDSVDTGGDTVVITCRDIGAYYLIRQAQMERPYEGPLEDVLNQMIDDNGLDPASSLAALATDPEFTIVKYMQQPDRLLTMLRALAQQRGWDLRYFVSTGKLRCYDPDRERTATDATFSAGDWIKVERFLIDDVDVRNQVRIWYAQQTGTMATTYAEDAPSMTQHGPQFVQIPMNRTRNLMDSGAATRYRDFALADMKDPLADFAVRLPLFPVVEVNDFYEYVADNERMDSNQKWAISGYTHEFDQGGGTTILETRGKPLAAYRDYRRGANDMAAISTDDPPAGTYLDGLVFPEGYEWCKTADLTFPA